MTKQDSDIRRKKRVESRHPNVGVLLVMLLVVIGCGPSVETVERTTDQSELAKIALEAKDKRVRLFAAAKLTDQTLLAKLALEPKNNDRRRVAVERLTDQALLAKLALEEKDKELGRVAVSKLTDQILLAKIALEANDGQLCGAAVERITDKALLSKMGMWIKPELTRQLKDETLLGKIAVGAKDWNVRRVAAGRVNDQALLAKIAMQDQRSEVRHIAVEKLTDQVVLAKTAMEDKDKEVRRASTAKLLDQAFLVKIAVEDKDRDVQLAAVKNLTHQPFLANLVSEHKDRDIRRLALERLTDQILLAKIAVNAKWLEIRVMAIGRVTDQALVRQWAEKDPQAAIRQAAVRRITDDRFLLQRLPNEPSAAVHAAIIETMRDKNSLREIALKAYLREDREHALQHLRRVLGDQATDVAAAHDALARRVKALGAETDSGKLLALVLEGEFDVLRVGAARQLSDPAALEQAALRCRLREVLKILLIKLENKGMMNRIAAEAEDRAMRLAVAQKGGTKSWQEIFNAATAKGATLEMLGDALAAASLFPAVQREAFEGVQHACLNLIRRGDESRIPEMVDLLEGYGDKILAEDYLNCGQPDLDLASREWARRHGFSVGPGPGSHRARWGSGK